MTSKTSESSVTLKSSACEDYIVSLTSQICEFDEKVVMYGLSFSDKNGEFEVFEALTCDKNAAEELFESFCVCDVDRTHIVDIIEDFVDAMHLLR